MDRSIVSPILTCTFGLTTQGQDRAEEGSIHCNPLNVFEEQGVKRKEILTYQ